jgi:hypothetical protein
MIKKWHCDRQDKTIKIREHFPKYQWIHPENQSDTATYQYEKIITDSTYTYTIIPKEDIFVEKTMVSGGDLREKSSVCELSDELLNEIKIKTHFINDHEDKDKLSKDDKNQEWKKIIYEINNYQKSHYYEIGPITKQVLDDFEIDSKKYILLNTNNEFQDNN